MKKLQLTILRILAILLAVGLLSACVLVRHQQSNHRETYPDLHKPKSGGSKPMMYGTKSAPVVPSKSSMMPGTKSAPVMTPSKGQ